MLTQRSCRRRKECDDRLPVPGGVQAAEQVLVGRARGATAVRGAGRHGAEAPCRLRCRRAELLQRQPRRQPRSCATTLSAVPLRNLCSATALCRQGRSCCSRAARADASRISTVTSRSSSLGQRLRQPCATLTCGRLARGRRCRTPARWLRGAGDEAHVPVRFLASSSTVVAKCG